MKKKFPEIYNGNDKENAQVDAMSSANDRLINTNDCHSRSQSDHVVNGNFSKRLKPALRINIVMLGPYTGALLPWGAPRHDYVMNLIIIFVIPILHFRIIEFIQREDLR